MHILFERFTTFLGATLYKCAYYLRDLQRFWEQHCIKCAYYLRDLQRFWEQHCIKCAYYFRDLQRFWEQHCRKHVESSICDHVIPPLLLNFNQDKWSTKVKLSSSGGTTLLDRRSTTPHVLWYFIVQWHFICAEILLRHCWVSFLFVLYSI